MRRIAIVLAFGAAAAPASPAADFVPFDSKPFTMAGRDCPEVTRLPVGRNSRLMPRRLGELPPADVYAAVYRLDERGCMAPLRYRAVRAGR